EGKGAGDSAAGARAVETLMRCTALLVLAGCFQPVEMGVHAVSKCYGMCPLGICDDFCADAGGIDGALCRTHDPCVAYETDTPTDPRVCAETAATYCITTRDGEFAVFCGDAGPRVVDCSGLDPCDAGSTPD